MAARKKRVLTPEEQLETALVPESEWPYEIPNNWCWVKTGTLATIHRGVSYKKPDASNSPNDSSVLILRGGNIEEGTIELASDNVYVDESLVDSSQYIRKGDIVIVASTGSTKVIGRAGVSDRDYTDVAFGAFLMLVRPAGEIQQEYLGYFFQSMYYRNRIRQLAAGVNINNIRADYIASMPIALPPLHEQRRIASRIEWLFAKLDDAEAELREVIDGSEQRQAAILHKAFSGELTAQWRNENKCLFSSWTRHAFRDLGTTKLGKMLDRAKNTGDAVPYLRNINVRWFDFDLSDIATMRVSKEEKSALQVKPGDLFICEGGEPGRCAVWQGDEADLVYQKALHRFRPKDGVLSEFVAYNIYYLSLSDELEKLFTGTTIKHLTGKSLAKMQLVLPPMEEQTKIVNCLNRLLGRESEAIGAANDALAYISALRSAVLSKALRGELGTNDPDEPSSKELLASIMSGNAD